tara:strand:+ start:395 stop:526 length:132 start_codon:yes stop_codon:yes gene_type:complete
MGYQKNDRFEVFGFRVVEKPDKFGLLMCLKKTHTTTGATAPVP